MRKTTKKEPEELSYFGLSLKSYLIDSHPLLANDAAFIAACVETATEAYSNAIRDGLPHNRAEELANVELYRELLFSPYNTIVNIIWNEFAAEIPEDDAREAALLLLPLQDCPARFLLPCPERFLFSKQSRQSFQFLLSNLCMPCCQMLSLPSFVNF
ncbi:hypothetical protein FACS1894207_1150 [Bacteroidia bacterium]|nr:hypothetical protein FACS1894207_1150 [Bacteroidia bacterium]